MDSVSIPFGFGLDSVSAVWNSAWGLMSAVLELVWDLFPLSNIRFRNSDLDSVGIRFDLWSSRFDLVVIWIWCDSLRFLEFEIRFGGEPV